MIALLQENKIRKREVSISTYTIRYDQPQTSFSRAPPPREVYRISSGQLLCQTLLTRAQGNHLGTLDGKHSSFMSYAKTVTIKSQKVKRTSEAAPGSLPGSAPLSTLARFLKVPARPSQRQAVCCVALVVHCRAVLRTESAVKPPGQHVGVLLAWVVLAGEVQVGVVCTPCRTIFLCVSLQWLVLLQP